MASIRKEIEIAVAPQQLWDALRDVGALHKRLVRGFVTDCRMDGDARIVTFANGLVAREVIVSMDDQTMRLVWSATGAQLSHHNAAAQVLPAGDGRCRLVWIADLLPNTMSSAIDAMMEQGARAMKATLELDAHGS